MNLRKFAVPVTVVSLCWLVGAATPVSAREVQCTDSMTVLECLEAHGALVVAEKTTAEVSKKTVGPDSFASRFANTYKDFLPAFDGFLNLDSIGDDGRSLTFNVNPQTETRPFQLQLKIWQPTVSETILAAFSEDIRATRKDEFEKGLQDLDDTEVIATYRINRSRGRDPRLYQDVFRRLVESVKVSEAALALDRMNGYLQDFEQLFEGEDDPPIAKYEEIETFDRARFNALAKEAAGARSEYGKALIKKLDSDFEPLADLVNNASQFYVSAAYRARPEIVGRDQFTAKLTYELGFADMGSLRKKLDECAVDDEASCPINKFEEAIKEWRTIEGGDRLSVSIEYTDTSGDRFEQMSDGVSLDLPSNASLVGTLAYGRYLGKKASAPRFDFSLSYEDVDDDPNRRDRWLGSAGVTFKVAKDLTIPIGLVYANHAKFLADVDEELSAHFGLRYTLPWGNEED